MASEQDQQEITESFREAGALDGSDRGTDGQSEQDQTSDAADAAEQDEAESRGVFEQVAEDVKSVGGPAETAVETGSNLVDSATDAVSGGQDETERSSTDEEGSDSGEEPQRRSNPVRGAGRAVDQDLSDDINDPIQVADREAAQRIGNKARALQRADETADRQTTASQDKPRDLGDDFVPASIERPLNQARDEVSQTAQKTISVTGGFTTPGVAPTGSGDLRLVGVSEDPSPAARGIGDVAAAPLDTAVAGVEVAETGAFGVGGTGLAGGSRQETIDRGETIAEEAEAFGERTVEAAEQNPTRFGSAIIAESALGGLAAGRLGGSRTAVTDSTRKTIRAGRRAGPQGRVSDFISEAEARAPRVEVVRDPDAGLIDVEGLISRGRGGSLPSRPSMNADTTLPRLRAKQKLREFKTDLEFSVNKARRIADERFTPSPRRGGDFAADADVAGGRVMEGFRNLRERAGERAEGEVQGIALDIGAARRRGRQIGRRAVDKVTPEPQRGGDFAVDADVTGGRLSPDVDVDGRVGGAIAGAQLSAEAAVRSAGQRLQRGRNRVSRRLTPEPRRGGDFAVDASVFGRSVDTDADPDIQTRIGGAIAGTRLSAEAAAGQARQRVSDGASQFGRRVVPEPRRAGGFAVDADIVGGTRLADDIDRFKREAGFAAQGAAISADLALERVKAAGRAVRNPGDIENPLAGISDTTIRVRPGRPAKQDRVLDARLFREGSADADPVFGFDIDEDIDLSGGGGRTGGDTIEVDIDTDAGQKTVKRIQEQRTGTGTDDVAREVDSDAGMRVGLATAPDVDQPEIAQEDVTTPSVTATAGDVEQTPRDVGANGLSDGFVTGPELDVGPIGDVNIRSDVGERTEADQRTDTRTRPKNAPDIDARTRPRIGTDTDIRFDEDVRTDTRTRVRTDTDTRRDGGIDIKFDADRREKRRRDAEFLTDLQDNPVTSPEERIETLFGKGGELK